MHALSAVVWRITGVIDWLITIAATPKVMRQAVCSSGRNRHNTSQRKRYMLSKVQYCNLICTSFWHANIFAYK